MPINQLVHHVSRAVETYIDSVPSSLFSTLETLEYMNGKGLGMLNFDEESLKIGFRADWETLVCLLDRFVTESDMEIGQFHFFKMDNWLSEYLNKYEIKQQGVDPFKVAYGFGLAFSDFLDHLKQQGEYQNSMSLYKATAKQLMLDALNEILEKNTTRRINAQMLLKLRVTTCKKEEIPLYGKFGVYAIFKNCSLIGTALQ